MDSLFKFYIKKILRAWLFLNLQIIQGKSTPYEFDTKIPFYVRGPGVKPPPKEKANSPTPPRKEITLNIDIAPTMLGFAGLSPPKSMDGLNMAGESRVFTNSNVIYIGALN